MDLLLSLLPGGPLTLLVGAVGGVALAMWRTYASGKSAGRNEQKVKEAEANAKHLQRVRDAANARPNDSVSNDPNNRDNR